MQQRILLLVIFILGLGLAWLYSSAYQVKPAADPEPEALDPVVMRLDEEHKALADSVVRPKRVILMIGDGMGLSQISAGMYRSAMPLVLEHLVHIGLVKVHSTSLITDSAAAATAMASGVKTRNGRIGMDTAKTPLKTLVDYAEDAGLSTGIVSSSSVTHATPACFYGHQPNRKDVNRLLAKQFETSGVDVLMGGGYKYFIGKGQQVNLLKDLEEAGYSITRTIDEAEVIENDKLICLIADQHPKDFRVRGDFLPRATKRAITALSENERGSFLMIEGAQIDWGGHGNDGEMIVNEMIDFDAAIEEAIDAALQDGETLVLVTADHECGGYATTGGTLDGKELDHGFTGTYHTASLVPIFAYGPGAELFGGVIDNTDIFKRIVYLMGWDENVSL